jgi:GNAT superfamily N-acetyltransferase
MTALLYKTYNGSDIQSQVNDVATARIEGFRDYPYLYQGNLNYEKKYLSGYCQEPNALLICVYDNQYLAAVATSIPLDSPSDIVAGAPKLFRTFGEDPQEYYYFAEIIVRPEYRGAGIAKEIYKLRMHHAASLGLRGLCLAAVERSFDHPLRPKDYKLSQPVWQREGFIKTDMTFVYTWPTIQTDGTVSDQENIMRFWTKKLRTDKK